MRQKMVLILSLFLSIGVGINISASQNKESKSRFEYLELFNKVLFMIESQYYREIDMKKLVYGAIKGMMETLDPHSNFLPEEMFDKMQNDTSGEFGGLGMEVTQKDGVIYIKTVFVDTPAFRHGLKSGDKIVEVEHESTIGYSLDELVKKMKGKPNTKINIGIVRVGVSGIKYFDIGRDVIKVDPGKFSLVEQEYAFIKLYQFQKGSGKFIRNSLKKLKKEVTKKNKKGRLKGIILDLRSNPGGLLDEAVEVASIFLKSGIVVSTEGRDNSKKDIRRVTSKGEKELELPLGVLISSSSASASEIVAGALQDHQRGIIMGERSFGKGSVQSVVKIDEKNGVKLTIAQYMTPNKRKIQALGIVPDIKLHGPSYGPQHNLERGNPIREIDLRNHLNATIETEEEKKLRVEKEKENRIKRIKLIEAKKNREKKKREKEILFPEYNPNKDNQVLEAVNYLKSFDVYKSFIRMN